MTKTPTKIKRIDQLRSSVPRIPILEFDFAAFVVESRGLESDYYQRDLDIRS